MGDFVFVPYSAHGHVHPMLPVIADMVGRGERVRVVVGERFSTAVAEVGAELVRLPRDVPAYVPDRVRARATLVVIRRARARREAARFLASRLRSDTPDLVVLDPLAPWAGRVARRLSVPTALFSTTYVTNEHVVSERSGLPLPLPLSAIRTLHPTARRLHGHRGLVLVNSIPELQPARHSLSGRVRFVGPLSTLRMEEPGDLPWARIGRGPILLVSPGTVFARAPEFFHAVARAFAGSRWTVVLATGHTDPAALGPLPENVIMRRYVPQLALLARTTVFLTHAGMNSALEAVAAAVPMILVPRSSEQRTVAAGLARLGVGVPLGSGDLLGLAERLAADQDVQESLNRLRRQVAPSATGVADLLVEQVDAAVEPRTST